MKRIALVVVSSLVLALTLLTHAQVGAPAMPPVPGSMPAHKFEKVMDGIYYATGTGTMTTGTFSAVIVNDDDVVLVDPGQTPAATRALLEDIKLITPKPVKFVVDTHYHYDHANGNQAIGPDIALIGHDRTRVHLLSDVLHQRTYLMNAMAPMQRLLDELPKQIAAESDLQRRAVLERQLAAAQLHAEQEKEIRPTPPTTTIAGEMTLYRGGREIQIKHLGRAHTDTDIVVFLPKERVVCTGDLIGGLNPANVNYAGDGFVEEWPATLEKLAALDFDVALPGHGGVFKGKEHIRAAQAYWRDLFQQVTTLRKQGVSPEDAAKRVDMRAHAKDFTAIKDIGVDVRTVDRIYDLAANPSAPVR